MYNPKNHRRLGLIEVFRQLPVHVGGIEKCEFYVCVLYALMMLSYAEFSLKLISHSSVYLHLEIIS